MAKQPEQILEEQLVAQLQKLGYSLVLLKDEKGLLANLKAQLEKHNNIQFSDKEFEKVLNILNKGSVFEKAKTLREKQHIVRDAIDRVSTDNRVSTSDNLYFEFINTEHWCQNQFQVTQQVSIEGKYKNRYDVTLLINGLPLVQIELKRRGLELKEAFNQVNRYQRHSFGANSALFQYVQIFVISNGVNTKYYANNKNQSFKQTFYWSDAQNKRLTNILNGFTSEFLEPCHISKMICKYIVLSEAHKVLMVLRPYQFYAVEALIRRVQETGRGAINRASTDNRVSTNGYIWHTTGSGKTLTSFKASQILTSLPQVKKVVFVVDRKDLDFQATKEFNSFSKGSIDGTDNTKALVKQFSDDTKLIVTTIQNLNTAIYKKQYLEKMEKLQDERIIFIFDECHRSQFGETHKRIKTFFRNIQLFGFTGTPIFADNAVKNDFGKRTTTELFGECLHKYVITDAIKDENVLKFSVEYVGRYKQKDDSQTNIDIEVEDIDTKELMESPVRLEKIADYILANHPRKTHNRDFTAMFCVNSVDTLIKYYDILQKKKEAGQHNLKIATIFSYATNEDDKDADGFLLVFRNLKKATDEAIALFSNKDAKDIIIMEPYEDYAKKFTEAYIHLLQIAPTVNSVNDLQSEEDELEFIKAFRELIRLKNVLTTFADFKWEDLAMAEQQFVDYRSKYLDLYDKVKSDHQKEKVSILEDVDFELELLHRDEINVTYILKLLAKLKDAKPKDQEKKKKEIIDLLSGEASLRSKRELIEKFIAENLPNLEDSDEIEEEFEKYWNAEQFKAFQLMVVEENLAADKTEKIIEDYLFAEREPLRDEVLDLIQGDKPTILQRKKVRDRILSKIVGFVETFVNGITGS